MFTQSVKPLAAWSEGNYHASAEIKLRFQLAFKGPLTYSDSSVKCVLWQPL